MGKRRRLRFLLPVLGMVVGLMAALTPAATADPSAAIVYTRIAADNTHDPLKCLTVVAADTSERAIQFQCDPRFDDQFWALIPTGPGSEWHWLQNLHSQKCLVVQGTANNTQAFQYTCSDQFHDQFFRVYSTRAGGDFMLQRYNPPADGAGKCLATRDNFNGSPVIQFTCNTGYADQWWHLI